MPPSRTQPKEPVRLLISPTGALYVETKGRGVSKAASSKELEDFGKVAAILEGITTPIVESWKNVKPKKATVEFGLAITLETGAFASLVTSASGTAHLIVTLEWENPSNSEGKAL